MVNSRPHHQVDWFLLRGCHVLGFPLILFYFKCRGSFLKKVFIEVVTVLLLLFLFQFWGRKVCGDLSSLSGNRTCTSCMEGKVLTTGLPEKSPCSFYMVTIPSSILRERKKIDKVQEVEISIAYSPTTQTEISSNISAYIYGCLWAIPQDVGLTGCYIVWDKEYVL